MSVTVTDRATRVRESDHKILEPYSVDPNLCLYSPQDNVESLENPRVRRWLDFVTEEYTPQPTDARRVLLFLPCTRTKPYIASSEHMAINARLLAEGFAPVTETRPLPVEILQAFPNADPQLFELAPLRRGDIEISRVVMSEPLAFVPYEHIVEFEGGPSPAVNYDDPGLFENRGNAVSPWRADSTATPVSATRWRWGPSERRAYVAMHNAMANAVARTLQRLDGSYERALSWVAPGLTHRSFCLAGAERSDHGVSASKLVDGKRLALQGVNDLVDEQLRIEVLPGPDDCDRARERLRQRLGVSEKSATAHFARGGGGSTPLAIPELLDVLIARLDDF